MCTELNGTNHSIYTTYNKEDGSTAHIETQIRPAGEDEKLVIKDLRELNDDFHDANKINVALKSADRYEDSKL